MNQRDITGRQHILEDLLQRYDYVFLLPAAEEAQKELLTCFCSSEVIRRTQKHILVLSEAQRPAGVGFSYRQLQNGDYQALRRLYHLYEFSDRFRIVSREEGFGGLFNLVDTGLLNLEEVFEALLT